MNGRKDGMMKILLVNHFPLEGSGSGIYTKNLANILTEQGHKVCVIYPEIEKGSKQKFDTKEIYFNGFSKDGLKYNFPCFTSHPRSNNTFYSLNESEIEEYVEIFCKIVKETADKFKPDIIHAQHLWITPYAALKSGYPYVITAHGTDLKGFIKDDRYHKYALEGAKNARNIITISKQVDKDTKKLFKLDNSKTTLILNGYDTNVFYKKEINKVKVLNKYEIGGNYNHIVMFVGKLTHFKGVDVLLKAARIYENNLSNVLTMIAGNGELYNELNILKKKLNLRNVYFLGHISQEELIDLYNIADVSTIPSRKEPFGLVAIEALACGTPVVATNQGGLPDFITKEVGYLVDVDDDIDLANGIVKTLLEKRKLKDGLQIEKFAKDKFSLENSIRQIVDIYKSQG